MDGDDKPMAIILSDADILAIERGDYNFLNNKGAKYYAEEDYERAIEYYRLAATMGSAHSISNLGYCYMYARSIAKNMSLAIAYFKIAAEKNNVDAQYKLGNIYEKGADGVEKNEELAIYYYTLAIRTINGSYEEEPERYPSLYLCVAQAHMPGGMMICDLKAAYQFLQIARRGYEIEKAEGIKYHTWALEKTLRLLEDSCFDSIREEMAEEDDD